MIEYLSLDEVVELHDVLLDKFGGLPGFRDKGLLESAIAAPMQYVFGEELHKTVYDKAAAYLFYIAKNHAFNDGNKRTATAAALIFLRHNGQHPKYNVDSLVKFVAETADGHHDIQAISKHLKNLCS